MIEANWEQAEVENKKLRYVSHSSSDLKEDSKA
jgi:hypothetical protein